MYQNLPFRRVRQSDSTAIEEITIGDSEGDDDEVTVTKETTPTGSRSRGSWSRSRSRSRSPIKDDGAVFTHRSENVDLVLKFHALLVLVNLSHRDQNAGSFFIACLATT